MTHPVVNQSNGDQAFLAITGYEEPQQKGPTEDIQAQ